MTIGGSHTLTLGADGLTVQAGAAAPTIATPVTLGADQTWTIDGGNPLAVSGVLSLSGFTLTKAGTAALQVTAPPNLGDGSTLAIDAGAVRFEADSGTAVVGAGVRATIAADATLELAGSISALSSGTSRANIVNDSAAPGLLISGTQQQVGAIDGVGITQVTAGSDLTAHRIIQTALIIGGTAENPATVTIDAADALGNPLTGGFALLGSPAPTGALDIVGGNSASLIGDSPTGGYGSLDNRLDDSPAGSSFASSAVPEPPSILLFACALLGLLGCAMGRQIERGGTG